jgi:hypothetical protein
MSGARPPLQTYDRNVSGAWLERPGPQGQEREG